ncbi:hypothetical protein HHI36_001539 [Cryptolaemus montrouzieri]|uniref:Endonuclease/exonuclease/phosphatase domain-containing protein n=1 Tax=Cryptolaemus montrouzieri TaxID=559131 RepID=A0ABD2P8L7_9CUCU
MPSNSYHLSLLTNLSRCELSKVLKKLYKFGENYIICGDTNIHLLEQGKEHETLNNLLNEYNIKSHIREPTRFDRSGAATCIDNISSNRGVLSECVGDTFLSDHTLLVCKFDHDIETESQPSYVKRRNYSPNNITLFENCLKK